MCATSAGGSAGDFQGGGDFRYTVEEFLRPFEITASYCKMNYDRPFVVYDTSRLSDSELEAYAEAYRVWLQALSLS